MALKRFEFWIDLRNWGLGIGAMFFFQRVTLMVGPMNFAVRWGLPRKEATHADET